MKVRLKSSYAGPRGTYQPGAVIELPAEEGRQLVDVGAAEAADVIVRRSKPYIDEAPDPEPVPGAEVPDEVEGPFRAEGIVEGPESMVEDPAEEEEEQNPTLADLDVTGHDAELLAAEGIHNLREIEDFGDLVEIKGIGEVTAAEIDEKILRWAAEGARG